MNKTKRIILYSTMLIAIAIGTIYFLLRDSKEYYLDLNIDLNDNVNNPINYEEIIKKVRDEYNNNDVKGILEIENTNYIVPIVQAKDNDYYLNHDAYRNENYMGAIYLDYRVDIESSPKKLIYGHNSSNIDMPFKILEEFYDIDYYSNHKYMWITTSAARRKYEIFSVYVEPTDYTYMNINFASEEDYLEHLQKLKSKSMYDTGVEVSALDDILILQTCSTHKDYRNYSKKYLLIILRRV